MSYLTRSRSREAKNPSSIRYKEYHLTKKRKGRDKYDGIVFVLGHSMFGRNGTVCQLETTGLRQKTLLVGNINASCVFYADPVRIDQHIQTRFADALSLRDQDIEDITYTTKKILSGDYTHLFNSNPEVKTFFDKRGIFSKTSNHFCEREWEFFNTPGTGFGRVFLLTRDDHTGKPYFAPLYEEKIRDGHFTLKKSELYEYLYSMKGIDNILLVDFGCTNLHPDLSENNKATLQKRLFGGTRKRKRHSKGYL